MRYRHTVFGIRVCPRLILEPRSQMLCQINRCPIDIAMGLTPEILHREHIEQHVAINEAIHNTFKLRRSGIAIEICIGVEMVRIVDIRTIVMIAIGRNHRHRLNHRLHTLLKPTLPFPFAVVGIAVLDEITGEAAETRFRRSLYRRESTTTRLFDICRIHDMTVAHNEE